MTQPEIPSEVAVEDTKWGMADILRLTRLRKRLIVISALAGAAVGLVLALTIPATYTAKATFLPPSSPSSGSSALLGQLSQLGALTGTGSGLSSMKDPSMVYIGILESRTVADDLIQQFHLQEIYGTHKLSETEQKLAKHTRFIPGKDTIVVVSVEDHDAQRATAIANAYLKALAKQNDRLALTESAQRRSFFERQLEREKNLLADAEVDLAKTEQQTGIIHPTGQAQAQIATIMQTQAAVASREIELASLSQGATSENPEVVRLRSEISSLKDQLRRLENSNAGSNVGNPLPSTAKVPELMLQYIRSQREVKYHEALYELLLRQFESAKLDESRSAPMVQVVDEAVVPDTKSWPPRLILILGVAFLAGVLGIAWIILPEIWRKTVSAS